MKKQLPTHNDEPSIKPAPKVLKVEEPNYEGEVKQGKYEVEEHISIHTDTQPQSKSTPRNSYPFDDIDIYAVDTRIWDRMSGMGGDGGGPHTHNEYADAQTLADHLANHPEGEGSYDDTELRGRVEQNETNISTLGSDLTSAEQNIQANTDALANKADADHSHEQEDIITFAYRFITQHYYLGQKEGGVASWVDNGVDENDYLFELSKTDADGKTFTAEVGPCDLEIKVGDDILNVVEIVDAYIYYDAYWMVEVKVAEKTFPVYSENVGELFWDHQEAEDVVPPHTHPEYEGGGSGGGGSNYIRGDLLDIYGISQGTQLPSTAGGSIIIGGNYQDQDDSNFDYSMYDGIFDGDEDGYFHFYLNHFYYAGNSTTNPKLFVYELSGAGAMGMSGDDANFLPSVVMTTPSPRNDCFRLPLGNLEQVDEDGKAQIVEHIVSHPRVTLFFHPDYQDETIMWDGDALLAQPKFGLLHAVRLKETSWVCLVWKKAGGNKYGDKNAYATTWVINLDYDFTQTLNWEEVVPTTPSALALSAYKEEARKSAEEKATRQARIDAFLESVANG